MSHYLLILSDKIFHILMILGIIEFWFQFLMHSICEHFISTDLHSHLLFVVIKNSANNKMLLLEISLKNSEQIFVENALLFGYYLASHNDNRFKLWLK